MGNVPTIEGGSLETQAIFSDIQPEIHTWCIYFSTVGAENMQKVPQRVLVPALSAPDQTKCGESKSLTLFKLGGASGGSRSDATMRR